MALHLAILIVCATATLSSQLASAYTCSGGASTGAQVGIATASSTIDGCNVDGDLTFDVSAMPAAMTPLTILATASTVSGGSLLGLLGSPTASPTALASHGALTATIASNAFADGFIFIKGTFPPGTSITIRNNTGTHVGNAFKVLADYPNALATNLMILTVRLLLAGQSALAIADNTFRQEDPTVNHVKFFFQYEGPVLTQQSNISVTGNSLRLGNATNGMYFFGHHLSPFRIDDGSAYRVEGNTFEANGRAQSSHAAGNESLALFFYTEAATPTIREAGSTLTIAQNTITINNVYAVRVLRVDFNTNHPFTILGGGQFALRDNTIALDNPSTSICSVASTADVLRVDGPGSSYSILRNDITTNCPMAAVDSATGQYQQHQGLLFSASSTAQNVTVTNGSAFVIANNTHHEGGSLAAAGTTLTVNFGPTANKTLVVSGGGTVVELSHCAITGNMSFALTPTAPLSPLSASSAAYALFVRITNVTISNGSVVGVFGVTSGPDPYVTAAASLPPAFFALESSVFDNAFLYVNGTFPPRSVIRVRDNEGYHSGNVIQAIDDYSRSFETNILVLTVALCLMDGSAFHVINNRLTATDHIYTLAMFHYHGPHLRNASQLHVIGNTFTLGKAMNGAYVFGHQDKPFLVSNQSEYLVKQNTLTAVQGSSPGRVIGLYTALSSATVDGPGSRFAIEDNTMALSGNQEVRAIRADYDPSFPLSALRGGEFAVRGNAIAMTKAGGSGLCDVITSSDKYIVDGLGSAIRIEANRVTISSTTPASPLLTVTGAVTLTAGAFFEVSSNVLQVLAGTVPAALIDVNAGGLSVSSGAGVRVANNIVPVGTRLQAGTALSVASARPYAIGPMPILGGPLSYYYVCNNTIGTALIAHYDDSIIDTGALKVIRCRANTLSQAVSATASSTATILETATLSHEQSSSGIRTATARQIRTRTVTELPPATTTAPPTSSTSTTTTELPTTTTATTSVPTTTPTDPPTTTTSSTEATSTASTVSAATTTAGTTASTTAPAGTAVISSTTADTTTMPATTPTTVAASTTDSGTATTTATLTTTQTTTADMSCSTNATRPMTLTASVTVDGQATSQPIAASFTLPPSAGTPQPMTAILLRFTATTTATANPEEAVLNCAIHGPLYRVLRCEGPLPAAATDTDALAWSADAEWTASEATGDAAPCDQRTLRVQARLVLLARLASSGDAGAAIIITRTTQATLAASTLAILVDPTAVEAALAVVILASPCATGAAHDATRYARYVVNPFWSLGPAAAGAVLAALVGAVWAAMAVAAVLFAVYTKTTFAAACARLRFPSIPFAVSLISVPGVAWGAGATIHVSAHLGAVVTALYLLAIPAVGAVVLIRVYGKNLRYVPAVPLPRMPHALVRESGSWAASAGGSARVVGGVLAFARPPFALIFLAPWLLAVFVCAILTAPPLTASCNTRLFVVGGVLAAAGIVTATAHPHRVLGLSLLAGTALVLAGLTAILLGAESSSPTAPIATALLAAIACLFRALLAGTHVVKAALIAPGPIEEPSLLADTEMASNTHGV